MRTKRYIFCRTVFICRHILIRYCMLNKHVSKFKVESVALLFLFPVKLHLIYLSLYNYILSRALKIVVTTGI